MRRPSSTKHRLDLVPPLADRFIPELPPRLRPGTSPHAFRIPLTDSPHGGHPALRSTTGSGSSFVLAVSSFRFRARLDVCIPSVFFGQRGITPAFGYSAPHLGARGTLTLPDGVLLSTRLAYSALACFRMGMSGSASFQRVRKSWYAVFAFAVSPARAYARPS